MLPVIGHQSTHSWIMWCRRGLDASTEPLSAKQLGADRLHPSPSGTPPPCTVPFYQKIGNQIALFPQLLPITLTEKNSKWTMFSKLAIEINANKKLVFSVLTSFVILFVTCRELIFLPKLVGFTVSVSQCILWNKCRNPYFLELPTVLHGDVNAHRPSSWCRAQCALPYPWELNDLSAANGQNAWV